MTQKLDVVTIIDTEFQYQPCQIVHDTNDETLEGLSCCEMLESIQTHSFLVQEEGVWNQGCCDHQKLMNHVVVMVIHNEFQSLPCLTLYHTYKETLEGSRCYEMFETVQAHSIILV